jgi:hypothetical protein
MRAVKWWIAAVGAVLVAAVAMTVWLNTRSKDDDGFATSVSPQAAVLAACPAVRAFEMPEPQGDLSLPWEIYSNYEKSVERGRFTMFWLRAAHSAPRFATVQ